MKNIIALFLLSSLMTGCATYKKASKEEDTRAKTFTAPNKDKAHLYIYRDEAFGAGMGMEIKINGQSLGVSGALTYMVIPLSPGKYTISSHAENDSQIELKVEGGKNYYIWQETKMALVTIRSQLHTVTEDVGKAGVKKCELITAKALTAPKTEPRLPASLK